MIIVPQTVILEAAATSTPFTHSRIGYHTYLRGLEASAVTVSSEAVNAPKDAPLREDTFEYWSPTALPATYVVDMGQGVELDYSGLHGLFFSAGVSVKMETSLNLSEWTEFGEEVVPPDDAPLMFFNDLTLARFLRYTFDASTPSDVLPQLAVCYAGIALAMERAIYGGHTPMTMSRKTERYQAFSRGGQFLGQNFRRHGVEGEARYMNLTADWVREYFDPFVKAARQFPFFYAWRPETFSRESVFVWATDDIRPSNMGKRNLMQVAWGMDGVGIP